MSKSSNIASEIERLEKLMTTLDPLSKDYYRTIKQVQELREIENCSKRNNLNISGDTLVIAGVNLTGILLILHHEKLNAISSRALGFITKLRF